MKPPPPIEILGLVAGFAIWSSAFVSLYAVHGGACDGGWFARQETIRVVLAVILALHLLLHAALCFWLWGRAKEKTVPSVFFLRTATFVLALAAAGATLWTSAPVFILRVCG